MWRRSLSLRAAVRPSTRSQLRAVGASHPRCLSTLTPEEQELMNEPREGMDYDVLLVRLLLSLSLSLL